MSWLIYLYKKALQIFVMRLAGRIKNEKTPGYFGGGH